MLLVGDVGATKTTLAVISPEAGARKPLVETTFASARYPSLEALVHDFLNHKNMNVDHACFGVAAPVIQSRARFTNLPWVVDESQLTSALNLSSVRLLNDLAAIAHAVPILDAGELHTLNSGQAEPRGNLAVIAPGTGLGEALLIWDGSRYQAYASEGGHADFAPTNKLELDLLRYLLQRYQHVSYERVCSGIGIPNIYEFLKESGYAEEPQWLAEQLVAADDPTPVIVNAALNGKVPCELCVETLGIFVSILGAATGNLALKMLATGGVYLGGGIPPRILTALQSERFLRGFRDKGRRTDLMTLVPVHVILHPNSALLGAAVYGLEAFRDA